MVDETFNNSAWFAGSGGSVRVARRLCGAVSLWQTKKILNINNPSYGLAILFCWTFVV